MVGFEPEISSVGSDHSTNCTTTRAVVVVELVEKLILEPEIRCSNPVIGEFL